LIEKSWTLCYYDIEEVGGFGGYLLLTCFYFFLVELGVGGLPNSHIRSP
jgi:hypothetical protein